MRQPVYFGDESLEFTPYRVLLVYTLAGRAVKMSSGRGLSAPRPEAVQAWAEAINRWAEAYGPRQRQGA